MFLRGGAAGICMWASARPAFTSSQTTLIRPVHRRLESPTPLSVCERGGSRCPSHLQGGHARHEPWVGAKLHRSMPGSRVCSLSLSLSKLINGRAVDFVISAKGRAVGAKGLGRDEGGLEREGRDQSMRIGQPTRDWRPASGNACCIVRRRRVRVNARGTNTLECSIKGFNNQRRSGTVHDTALPYNDFAGGTQWSASVIVQGIAIIHQP